MVDRMRGGAERRRGEEEGRKGWGRGEDERRIGGGNEEEEVRKRG